MATDDEFQAALDDGQVHTFTARTRTGGDVVGRVVRRSTAVLTTADGGATRAWDIEDARGNTHAVASADYDID